MNILKLTKILNDNNWKVETIRIGRNTVYWIQTYSALGQDFSADICCNNVNDFADKLEEYADDFDVSQEAYKWLDCTGHGINGAPYEMIDVYNDTKDCEQKMYKLVKAVRG